MSLQSRITNVIKKLDVLASKSGKGKFWLINDYWTMRKHRLVSFEEYCNFQLYKSDSKLRIDFLSYRMAEKYWEILNPKKYASLARDKFLSHCVLDSIGIPTAELIAYYNPEAGCTSDIIGRNYNQIRKILKVSGVESFVIKPSQDSAHGHGVVVCRELIEKEDDLFMEKYNGERVSLKQMLGTSPLLLERVVIQSAQLMNFNNSSLNSVRIMTALYPDTSVKLLATFLKIGREDSDVDNAGVGGNVDCGIDPETGVIYNAFQFNSWDDIKKIDSHPDSGSKLEGTKIQGWDEIIERLKYYQGLLPQLKTIGWDVAITDHGPVIIEINNWWDTTGQFFIDKGWAKEVKDCYDAWKEYYKK